MNNLPLVVFYRCLTVVKIAYCVIEKIYPYKGGYLLSYSEVPDSNNNAQYYQPANDPLRFSIFQKVPLLFPGYIICRRGAKKYY